MTNRVPAIVRGAGVVVAAQGASAAACAVFVLVGSTERRLALGTSALFVLISAALISAGWALWTGRRWGRGVAVFAQLLLLPVAWYMSTGSHLVVLGVPLGMVALATLLALFSPSALKWAAYQGDSASSDSAGPDSR